ncbi:MAG: biotin--[Clostridia bacterium]|nr:biotin--[acetyl-CoA-carboxylase] ligase [Clostridia bacterium]
MKDIFLLSDMKEALGRLPIEAELHELCDSTNRIAKERLVSGCKEWHTVIALGQSAGQGRLGRSFFSPTDSGLYMSCVLYPPAEKAMLLTGMAAVALCEALEETFGLSPSVKWVNDIYLNSKKVCGILAKGVFEKGKHAVILGIGINVYPPSGGFPREIDSIAGALFTEMEKKKKARLAAAVLKKLYERYSSLGEDDAPEQYRKRCFTIGQEVNVIPIGTNLPPRPAKAICIDDRFFLEVEYENGQRELLSSGEVSVKVPH